MSECELTGKKTMSGNNVSHSERKTKRKFKVNIQHKSFFSEALKINVSFNVCANAIKTVDKKNGIDSYLMKTSSDLLSVKAKAMRSQIKKHISL
jgi:large subunit ribosomal protein L28